MAPEIHLLHDAGARTQIEDIQVAAFPQIGQDTLPKQRVIPAVLESGVELCIQPAHKAAHESLPRNDQHEKSGIGQPLPDQVTRPELPRQCQQRAAVWAQYPA